MSPQSTVTTGNFNPSAESEPLPTETPALRALDGGAAEPKPQTKKILLLEDDPAFKEIMTDFLGESGYEVVAVQNGVEGVHQVLASDFEVILCDMMMPTLPGDMFFRAVERMRPHLCDRFVFMTGHRGNAKVNEFIENVCGTILTKPFHVDDLLEMIAFIQVRVFLLAA